ncbi:hypothetical protein STEG23_032826 [Scotinomys teguina]
MTEVNSPVTDKFFHLKDKNDFITLLPSYAWDGPSDGSEGGLVTKNINIPSGEPLRKCSSLNVRKDLEVMVGLPAFISSANSINDIDDFIKMEKQLEVVADCRNGLADIPMLEFPATLDNTQKDMKHEDIIVTP